MELFLGLILLCVVVIGPIASIVAVIRLRALERRVTGLEARLADIGGRPSAPSAVRAAASPDHAPVAAVADDGTGEAPAPVAAASAAAPAPAASSFDWEAAVAGRWLNRVGLVAVAIGVSYFLKLAIDSEWIGPRGQVIAGMITGLALVAWSAILSRRLRYFADGMAGLGAAILYLSIWAAGSYYQMMAPGLTFICMAAVAAAMTGLAVSRSSAALAVLAMVGGFLTPALVSSGRDAQVVLFLYLAAQNMALLALARLRDWRFLELPAFVFTQLYFWTWFDQFYTDAVLVRTAIFAALFFAQFSALPVIRVRQTGILRPEQGLLVLANAAFILGACHALLWPDRVWVLTGAFLGLAVCHLALARAVPSAENGESTARVLFAGLALTCATLAVPIRLEHNWITIALAVEGAVLAWSGFHTRLWYLRAAALVLLFSSLANLLATGPEPARFLFNGQFAAALVLVGASAIAVWRAGQCGEQMSRLEAGAMACVSVGANMLMVSALTREVYHYFGPVTQRGTAATDLLLARSLVISLLWTAYATGLVLAGARMRSAAVRWQGLALFGVVTLKVFLVDLDYLSGFYRIGSSIALGVVLLAVSLLYQRKLAARQFTDRAAR